MGIQDTGDLAKLMDEIGARRTSRILGELEIRPEPLRYVICISKRHARRQFNQHRAMDFGKVGRAMRNTIRAALISGDGIQKIAGHPAPQLWNSDLRHGGKHTTRSIHMARPDHVEVDRGVQFHGQGRAYLMNQNTFALISTMPDAAGRPIMIASPVEAGQFLINGSPVVICT